MIAEGVVKTGTKVCRRSRAGTYYGIIHEVLQYPHVRVDWRPSGHGIENHSLISLNLDERSVLEINVQAKPTPKDIETLTPFQQKVFQRLLHFNVPTQEAKAIASRCNNVYLKEEDIVTSKPSMLMHFGFIWHNHPGISWPTVYREYLKGNYAYLFA